MEATFPKDAARAVLSVRAPDSNGDVPRTRNFAAFQQIVMMEKERVMEHFGFVPKVRESSPGQPLAPTQWAGLALDADAAHEIAGGLAPRALAASSSQLEVPSPQNGSIWSPANHPLSPPDHTWSTEIGTHSTARVRYLFGGAQD